MVSSLDGYIARKDNDVSWMESSWGVYQDGVTGEDDAELLKSIDCYIMGSRTYELALELGWPYGETPVIVVTNRELESTKETVEFYSGYLRKLTEIVQARYKNIWLVGGAILSQEFLKLELVDEICMTVIPILLGDGISFFGNTGTEKKLRLKNVVAFKNGMIDLWYTLIKNNGGN